MALPVYATTADRLVHYAVRTFAASTLLIAFSVCLVTVLEALRRRTERLTRAPGAPGAHS